MKLLKKLSLKSSEGRIQDYNRVAPEKLHPVCANKLLKLLEEPPERTIFLLVSEKPDMILPTIQSRTQRMNVRKIDEASIDRVLQTKYSIQPADSLSIAHLANGNFIKALETIHLNEDLCLLILRSNIVQPMIQVEVRGGEQLFSPLRKKISFAARKEWEKYHWPLHTHAISVAPTGVKRMPAVYVRPA